ncbi:hypothetical protein D3C74_357670 [compost metagenome]
MPRAQRSRNGVDWLYRYMYCADLCNSTRFSEDYLCPLSYSLPRILVRQRFALQSLSSHSENADVDLHFLLAHSVLPPMHPD